MSNPERPFADNEPTAESVRLDAEATHAIWRARELVLYEDKLHADSKIQTDGIDWLVAILDGTASYKPFSEFLKLAIFNRIC